jgi:hypothetical protein
LAIQPEHPVWKEIRLINGAIEGKKQRGTVVRLLSLAPELRVTCFALEGALLATGHLMPVVHLWKIGDGIAYAESLLVHLSPVSAIALVLKPWQLIAVGHEDGAVSLVSWPSRRFLRTLETQRSASVSLIRMSPTSGDILIGQQKLITLWTPNGTLVRIMQFEADVIDAVFTTYSEGVLANLLFVLYGTGAIAALAAHDLDLLSDTRIDKEDPVSLTLKKAEKTVIVGHADGGLSLFTFN